MDERISKKISKLKEFRDERMKTYAQVGHKDDRYNPDIERDLQDGFDLLVRNEFSRDRDRIKYSRAFRRLEHKAQIYSHKKGDHFRTRLTHTLEVVQIARSLSRNLNLNEDLVEAIAVGHDIGHTPFGHQGERTLDKIMTGEDDLSGKLRYRINYGGFKHNFHSLKILDQLEVKHDIHKGMNLTWQVLEGVLKHTKIKRHKVCKNCGNCWDIKRFISNKEFLEDYLEHRFSVTLEGQIVAVADEIAQRQHDIDDGMRDKDLSLNFSEVSEYLIAEFNKVIQKNSEDTIYIDNLENLKNNIEKEIPKTNIRREDLYKITILAGNVIDFFIKDVTIKSLENIYKDVENNVVNHNGKKIFTKNFVNFSSIGKEVNDIIEKYIKTKILNSYNVNRFDGKAIYIIRRLFKAYYTNPRQMPKYILKRLLRKIKEVTDKMGNPFLAQGIELGKMSFSESKPQEIENFIKLLKLEISLKDLEIEKNIDLKELMNKDYVDENGFLKEDNLTKLNQKDLEELDKNELFIKALLEVHYIYLSTVCDYIAGMTDNYACSEFKNLYLVD